MVFTLSSSDNGSFGMNTPSYFCIDNFTTLNTLATDITKNHMDLNVNIYPNPTSSSLNIDYNKNTNSNLSIKILDVTGKEVFSNTLYLLNNTIDLSSLDAGIYILRITNDEGSSITKKILKN